jgi:Sir2- and TIR-associating SLOG family/SIR2-like domain
MVDRAHFVEEWSAKLARGAASAFVGAGTSMGAGYPSWRALLRTIAAELELDIDQEHDLAAVAQHYVNRNGSRSRLTQVIANQFPRKPVPPVLRLLARLPLRQVWTTNWDELIENAFTEMRRDPDIKERPDDLTYEPVGADVVVYKMHGSVRHLGDVVLATDDFELYRIKREAFLRILAGHLISTSFLFIGVSFTDPNLGHLLAGIREMYERYAPKGHGQPHYAILRTPQEADFRGQDNADARFKTAAVRHKLFVEDLKRYNIHCVPVDRHEEAEAILTAVEQRIAMRAVFVSGSLAEGALPPDDAAYVRAVAREVGKAVADSGKRLVSGYGLGIGDQVLSGMLVAGWLDASSNLDKRITIRPFPQTVPADVDRTIFNRRYREDLVALAGTCIVVCGIRAKKDEAGFENAPGVKQEVEIATSLGRHVVPIGATYGAAAELWKDVSGHLDKLDARIPRDALKALGVEKTPPETIGKALLDIVRALG